MSEGMGMVLLILLVFIALLLAFVFPQIRRENKWDEGGMIDSKKNKKAQKEDKDRRDF